MHTTIRYLREQRNISQDSMAEQLDISRATYIRIESGDKSLTVVEVQAIAEILGISSESLLLDVRSEKPQPIDEDKYKQILEHCIYEWSSPDGKITKAKLAKLAYLVDFAWYYEHFVSLSGLQYRRLQQGPVPDAYFLAIDELIESGNISIEIKGRAQLFKNEDIPSRRNLSDEELACIGKICAKWRNTSTEDIVKFTHEQIPWKLCREKELIPYELITQEEPDHVY